MKLLKYIIWSIKVFIFTIFVTWMFLSKVKTRKQWNTKIVRRHYSKNKVYLMIWTIRTMTLKVRTMIGTVGTMILKVRTMICTVPTITLKVHTMIWVLRTMILKVCTMICTEYSTITLTLWSKQSSDSNWSLFRNLYVICKVPIRIHNITLVYNLITIHS